MCVNIKKKYMEKKERGKYGRVLQMVMSVEIAFIIDIN